MAPERGDRSVPAGTEGLPRLFLQSLRTLFDILDDRRRGYVHLREIESRWRGAEAQEVPAGVMEGLRRAAPASGYLTFERFVLGLRAALPGAELPLEGGGARRRSAEEPPSPRCSEERRGKSARQRDPGHGAPRGRGEWRGRTGGFGLVGTAAPGRGPALGGRDGIPGSPRSLCPPPGPDPPQGRGETSRVSVGLGLASLNSHPREYPSQRRCPPGAALPWPCPGLFIALIISGLCRYLSVVVPWRGVCPDLPRGLSRLEAFPQVPATACQLPAALLEKPGWERNS